jgi:hypothetical protein
MRLAPAAVSLNLFEYHDPSKIPAGVKPSPLGILPFNNGSTFPIGYLPTDLQIAYGIDQIMFGNIQGDGTGQTIALVDAYDDPAFVDTGQSGFANSDLAQFDAQVGIPDPPNFTKYNEYGQTTNLPGTDPAGAGNPNGNWEIEEALDIEYAHGIAPGANIDLVEATTDSISDLFKAIATAASLPGVSAVSMSWGLPEYSGELSLDSTFVTPKGHQGVTFVAATGDQGSPGYYPAYSPNVVAAGGTTLNLNGDSTYNSETAWSGSGGGTSQYETEPSYQEGVQTTGYRTIPDVAFDADPGTGVAVYDSYNDTDNSGPWVQVGGTSLASPAWAALIAIANQGRALNGDGSLDGPTQTLPALYATSSNDFHDITKGSNGGFNAGPGYDEVTGLGSPVANLLVPDLITYGTASQIVITAQPPSSVIAADSFGVVVSAEDANGHVDPGFNGTVTLSLANNPGGSTLKGTLTVNASDGQAVFDGLTLNKPANGYTLKATTAGFPAVTSNPFNVTTNTTPWQGTFYPVPTDASLRAAINQADSNGFANNVLVLTTSTYVLTDLTSGAFQIQNTSSLPSKTLTIIGQGQANTIIAPRLSTWQDRIFEIVGTSGAGVSVVFENLSIAGGNARDGGVLGGSAALGGGLLIDDADVTLANVTLKNNQALGAAGATGAVGAYGKPGSAGGNGDDAQGGAIYLASGTLDLFGVTFSDNHAQGGQGGMGGRGGGQNPKKTGGYVTGGSGGAGGAGGTAAGGGLYVAGGTVILANSTFNSNRAVGGPGGTGGTGGSGVSNKHGGLGGKGGAGGAAFGGAIYLGQGSLTLTAASLQANSAIGGVGGFGGHGGPGTALVSSSGITKTTGLTVYGGPGGNGGAGGAGAIGAGGGVYVAGGSLTILDSTLGGNQAVGGQGGIGGTGGIGGLGPLTKTLPQGLQGGLGGKGGAGGDGRGGGFYVAGGSLTLNADTLSANTGQGGAGGAGGRGGNGGLAQLGSGTIIGTGTGTITGTGGGTAPNTAGAGGNGGNGGKGQGGGLYLSSGSLTLINATVATNAAYPGAAGSAGAGGKAGTGKVTGGPGNPGAAGAAYGGGLYVNGGSLSLDNSTVALNKKSGAGSAGGVYEAAGTVMAVSTLFAGNGGVDYYGSLTATDCLFQTKPSGGTLSGSGNLVGVNPLLDTKGLQNNGGPTQTIALQATSPAIGAGANPENLLTDQRGFAARSGSKGTDIGAYQHDATADTAPPTATLQATNVTAANAGSLNPYTFTITYTDNVAIASASVPGAVVQVIPPSGGPAIAATVVSVTPSGPTDALGDAPSIVVTYQITPPGGSWASSDDGTYTVAIGGASVLDLASNAGPTGTLGTFSVNVSPATQLVITAQPPSSIVAGSGFGLSVAVEDGSGNVVKNYSGTVMLAMANDPTGATLRGKLTVTVTNGVAHFSGLTVDIAGTGYTIEASSSGLTSTTTTAFSITPAPAAKLAVTTQPPASVTAGSGFGLSVAVEDRYGNVVMNDSGSVTIALAKNPGNSTLGGTLTASVHDGVASFSGLTLNKAGSGYTLQATSTGLTSATTKGFAVTPAAATQLVITKQPPSSIIAGSGFSLNVSVEDAYGNVEKAYNGTVTIALVNDPTGAMLHGTLTVSVSYGVAHFSGLTVDIAGTGYTIEASSSGLTSTTTTAFSITPAPAAKLAVTTQPPSSVVANSPFGLVVTIEDRYGNVVTDFSGSVTLTIAVNPGGATLGGTTTLAFSNGQADFSNLTLNQPGKGYKLKATSGTLTTTTAAFDVT